MMARITSLDNPSFFFLHYDRYEVNNLIIVPKCFFIPEIIEKSKPLPDTARRAGWEGCNILLGKVPEAAKIPIIRNGEVLDAAEVCQKYNQVYALQTKSLASRGWLFDVLQCTEKLDTTFTLEQMYFFVTSRKPSTLAITTSKPKFDNSFNSSVAKVLSSSLQRCLPKK